MRYFFNLSQTLFLTLFTPLGSAIKSITMVFLAVVLLFALPACHSKSKGSDTSDTPPDTSSPLNVGGGYTLVVSGGTLNDGSGVNGLTVLATLRDDSGYGPGGAAGWEIEITGPGIVSPLVVSYEDGSPASYSTWWWEQTDPQSGTYTATASDGTTTLIYDFSIQSSSNLSQPDVNVAGTTVFWDPVSGAGSYYYELTDGSGVTSTYGYIESDPLLTQYSFELPAALPDGSYLVSVYALTANRLALGEDNAAWPSLPAQENDAVKTIDFVQGGTGSGYVLNARGGVLYEGSFFSTDYYGLVVWTSILTTTTPETAPAGNWDVTVTGPGIATPITFTYPKTDSHYIYWDFGTVPDSGTYTVSAIATGSTTTLSTTFTVPNTTSKLPVATGLAATATSGGGASVSWNSVSGAGSYYVNIWAEIDGYYTEVAGGWVNATSAIIPSGTLTEGVTYDVYVSACQLDMMDMNSVPLPVAPDSQVDMSDTTFGYDTIVGLK